MLTNNQSPAMPNNRVKRELQHVVSGVQDIAVTDLQGFDPDETTTFLRADGTFASAGLTQAQVLARLSLRV